MTDGDIASFLAPGTDRDVEAAYARLADRARDTSFGFEDEVVVVDIETTGFDPATDSIIEVAAAVLRGPEVVARYGSLVDPGAPLSPETVKLIGICDADLVDAPPFEDVATELARFAAGRDLVAHNAVFDRTFLEANGCRLPGVWLDTLELARIALPRLRSHRLADLARALGSPRPSHRAGDDVESLALVWRVLRCALDDLPDGLLARLVSCSPSTAWSLRSLLAHHASARPCPPADLRALRRARVRRAEGQRMRPASEVDCTAPGASEVADAFSPAGVAGRMYEGYEIRPEQCRMAEAVSAAFGSGTHLAVEAGTGVGKSVAYLLPAVLFALRNEVTVGVATKTNSLTDQLVHGEIPALTGALGVELRAVQLKGYENYLCLRKLERVTQDLEGLDPETLGAVAALWSWVAQTTWGDLDSVNLHWRPELRARMSASVADCTRRRCRFHPDQCYLHGVRRRAAGAHLVVTNQSLLFRDAVAAGGILPDIRYWIVDEAHGAESEARRQLSLRSSHAELRGALRSLHAKDRGGLVDSIARQSPRGGENHMFAALEDMRASAEKAAVLAESMFDFVKDLGATAPESGYEIARLRVTPTLRESGTWGSIEGVARSLARTLDHLIERGGAVVTTLEEAGDEHTLDQRADLVGLLTRLADQREALLAVVSGDDPCAVHAVTLDRRRQVRSESMESLRLDVGEVLAETFLAESRSVVFCSATIATGEDFGHFARGVGLDRSGTWSSMRLASSYDLERQMSVFVPDDVAAPGSRAYLADMERLLEGVHRAMGGSVLTLFTNRRDMEELYLRLASRLEAEGLPLLVQGRGTSAKRIRDEFLADHRLSLFATKTFWEGFDAKGDTLRCVIVPKLPFGQLSDPLLEARKEISRDWWARHYLPEAIIELKQAAGRLVRSSTDTGCLVLADARLAGDRAYGRSFLEALPVRRVVVAPSAEVLEEIAARFGQAPADPEEASSATEDLSEGGESTSASPSRAATRRATQAPEA